MFIVSNRICHSVINARCFTPQSYETRPRSSPQQPPLNVPNWKPIVARYQQPSLGRALWQIVNTLVPYAALWYLMYLSLAVSWWLTVPLAVLAGAFLVRVFIIFHDCGHGSFFKSHGRQ